MQVDHQYSGAVHAGLAASRVLAALILAAAALTLALLAILPGDVALRILAGTWTACVALHSLASVRRARRVAIAIDGSVEVLEGGEWKTGHLVEGSFVAPFLTIVRWRPHGARLTGSVVIVPGMMAAREFRALRVLLRWR
jgi:hypothetical protein